MKANFPGIIKNIESRALRNLEVRKNKNTSDLLLTWNDWIDGEV